MISNDYDVCMLDQIVRQAIYCDYRVQLVDRRWKEAWSPSRLTENISFW